MDLARQVTHLLRERGETEPAPLVGGVAVERRADDGVNVYWRTRGRLALPFLRLRSLRRYERILGELGMRTALRQDGGEPYVATWLAPVPRAHASDRLPDVITSASARDRVDAVEERVPALRR